MLGLCKAKLVALRYLSPKEVKEICSVQRLRDVEGVCGERFCLGVDTRQKMYLLLVSSDILEFTFVFKELDQLFHVPFYFFYLCLC